MSTATLENPVSLSNGTSNGTAPAAPVVRPLGGPNDGYEVTYPDGRVVRTPAAKQTAAARLREELIATDVTRLTPYVRRVGTAQRTFYIASWGRDDRTRWREDARRAKSGTLKISESPAAPLSDDQKFTIVCLYLGVRDEDGVLFFGIDDIAAYQQNEEDDDLLSDLLTQVMQANVENGCFKPSDQVEKKVTEQKPRKRRRAKIA